MQTPESPSEDSSQVALLIKKITAIHYNLGIEANFLANASGSNGRFVLEQFHLDDDGYLDGQSTCTTITFLEALELAGCKSIERLDFEGVTLEELFIILNSDRYVHSACDIVNSSPYEVSINDLMVEVVRRPAVHTYPWELRVIDEG